MSKVKKPRAAHRPLKYGEPTKIVPVRMPVSRIAAIRKLIADYLKQFET